jgi:hypothetical protein
MTKLWQQTDEVIDRYLKAAVKRLTGNAMIPQLDDVDNTDRYERLIDEVAEEIFQEDN